MSTDHNQHDANDTALDKILAAMRNAAPPEGMEARITQRLQQHAAAPSAAPLRWRDALANFVPTGEWWRGAIAGAVAASLLTAALLLTGHLPQTRPDRMPTARNGNTVKSVATVATRVADSPYGTSSSHENAQPCAHPTMLRTASIVPLYKSDSLRAETRFENDAPSHPAPPLPLTAQERALIRLAQTASPSQLALLSPVEYAHLEAESALKFEKFFASPAPLPAPDSSAATPSVVNSEASSEGNPKPDSAVSPADNTPAINRVDKPEINEEHSSPTKEEE